MNNDKKEIINRIPKTSTNRYSFKDFIKIIDAYSTVLSKIIKHCNNNIRFSKNDVFIIKDLVIEISNYSKELSYNNFINESKYVIEIGTNITENFYTINSNSNSNGIREIDFLRNPLLLKLFILEAKFNLYFKYIKDYNISKKIILEIIEIQKILDLSKFNIGSSYFYLGLVNFFLKTYDESEEIIKNALKLLTPLEFELDIEKNIIKKKPRQYNNSKEEYNNNDNEFILYDISIKKSCNVLRVLGEIYLLKKDYKNSINCIENAYNLYFDKYGPNYGYTIFLKNKLKFIYNKIKKHLPIDYK